MRQKSKGSAPRLLLLLALLPASVLVVGTLYMLGMDQLEGSPRTLLQGIQWPSETITNTGYGADNRWNHPVMAGFVIVTLFVCGSVNSLERYQREFQASNPAEARA